MISLPGLEKGWQRVRPNLGSGCRVVMTEVVCRRKGPLTSCCLSHSNRLARLRQANRCFAASVKWFVSEGWQAGRWMPQGHRQLKLWGRPNKRLTEMIMITSGEVAACGLRFSHRKQMCSYMAVIWAPAEDTVHLFQWETCKLELAFVYLSSMEEVWLFTEVPLEEMDGFCQLPCKQISHMILVSQSVFVSLGCKDSRVGNVCVSCSRHPLRAKASGLSRTYGGCKKMIKAVLLWSPECVCSLSLFTELPVGASSSSPAFIIIHVVCSLLSPALWITLVVSVCFFRHLSFCIRLSDQLHASVRHSPLMTKQEILVAPRWVNHFVCDRLKATADRFM